MLALLRAQLFQTFGRQHQRLVFLAETEANLLRAKCWIAVEARPGHAGYADFANQMTSEFDVVFEAEAADVGHDVISPVRPKSSKTCFLKFRQNQIAPRFVVLLQLLVIRRRKSQRISAGGLQRRSGSDSQKVMNF